MDGRSIEVRLSRDVDRFVRKMEDAMRVTDKYKRALDTLAGAHMELGATEAALCESAGLVGEDRDTAIRAYVNRGRLDDDDRELLAGMSQPQRDTYIAKRWGSDGARVAQAVWAAEL